MIRQLSGPPTALLDLVRQTAEIREELDSAIARVLDHGKFILGPEVAELEDQVASYCQAKYAVSCASGSDALLLPLMALNVGTGDRVITSPFTFFATAGSIARLGAEPVFVDIDPDTYNLSPEALAAYLASCSSADIRTIKAIIPIHLFGQCAEMAALQTIAGHFGIPVIEDAAQAIGAEFRGRKAGSMGLCGAFSFFPSKNLGGFGDGGMITTDDPVLAEKLIRLRGHGSNPKYYHSVVGMNSRLDTLQAAILLVKFRYLEKWTSARRANAEYYTEYFSRHLPGQVVVPVQRFPGRHVYNQYTIRVQARDAVRHALNDLGVATDVYYPVPLHLQACFRGLGYAPGDLPVSETAAREVLSIPIDPCLTPDELSSVAQRAEHAIRKVAG